MHEEDQKETDDPHLFLIIPEKGMVKIQEQYPELLPLAKAMQKKEISFELSQQVICTYVVENIDGKLIARDTAASVMDSISFQVQLQMFNTWVQLHAEQLEQSMHDFEDWKKMFGDWKSSSKGQELLEKLTISMQNNKSASK